MSLKWSQSRLLLLEPPLLLLLLLLLLTSVHLSSLATTFSINFGSHGGSYFAKYTQCLKIFYPILPLTFNFVQNLPRSITTTMWGDFKIFFQTTYSFIVNHFLYKNFFFNIYIYIYFFEWRITHVVFGYDFQKTGKKVTFSHTAECLITRTFYDVTTFG
jgi:hypothetical protein